MSKVTVPTHEMIQNLAEHIVDNMGYEELKQHVYSDIYCVMLNDTDMFYNNLEELDLHPEDFTNAKFRGE